VNCPRCGGFRIYDYCYETVTSAGFRCINCGAISDLRVVALPPGRSSRTGRQPPTRRPTSPVAAAGKT
jgi:hypothetical protein